MWKFQQRVSNNNEDDLWEERAFAEDDILGATWPPRSYTCTFCRREFRSAQALGGHMNVHRRDRARLKGSPSGVRIDESLPSLLFPASEFVEGSSLCLLYSFPTPGSVFTPIPVTPKDGSFRFPSSAVLSLSPYALSPCSPSTGFAVASVVETTAPIDCKNITNNEEELDLELRLGHRPMK
ncbi:hypothetical protein MRB53_025420 [Persea americana]|uniref:Uncharacterized protein n=1 Tax=Persea americana TaxID=3435 RepID=A0ACC2LGC7_PERAE|nr:hypothetical protein MRB53_025420 [Persea americana]